MKVAVIGSREIRISSIDKYMPEGVTMLISGGARGIDTLAEGYADKNGIPKQIFKPDYLRHGRGAPLIRNKLIVENADVIIAIWNGISKGTKFTIDYAKSIGKKIKLVLIDVTGTEIFPGKLGKNCPAKGEHPDEKGNEIECCCDECDFLQCCISEQENECSNCQVEYCPRTH